MDANHAHTVTTLPTGVHAQFVKNVTRNHAYAPHHVKHVNLLHWVADPVNAGESQNAISVIGHPAPDAFLNHLIALPVKVLAKELNFIIPLLLQKSVKTLLNHQKKDHRHAPGATAIHADATRGVKSVDRSRHIACAAPAAVIILVPVNLAHCADSSNAAVP